MKLKIKADAVKMPCDQWTELVYVTNEKEVIVRSCGRPNVLWIIKPFDIVGFALTEKIRIGFDIMHITEND